MYAKYQISMYSKTHLNISKIMYNLDNIYICKLDIDCFDLIFGV